MLTAYKQTAWGVNTQTHSLVSDRWWKRTVIKCKLDTVLCDMHGRVCVYVFNGVTLWKIRQFCLCVNKCVLISAVFTANVRQIVIFLSISSVISSVSVHNVCSPRALSLKASWAKHNRGINYLMQIRNKSINGFNFILLLFLLLLFICLLLFLFLPICAVSKISSTELNFLMSFMRTSTRGGSHPTTN